MKCHGVTGKRRRLPSLPGNALYRGGCFQFTAEQDKRPAHGGEWNITKLWWNGRRYAVPHVWRRWL